MGRAVSRRYLKYPTRAVAPLPAADTHAAISVATWIPEATTETSPWKLRALRGAPEANAAPPALATLVDHSRVRPSDRPVTPAIRSLYTHPRRGSVRPRTAGTEADTVQGSVATRRRLRVARPVSC